TFSLSVHEPTLGSPPIRRPAHVSRLRHVHPLPVGQVLRHYRSPPRSYIARTARHTAGARTDQYHLPSTWAARFHPCRRIGRKSGARRSGGQSSSSRSSTNSTPTTNQGYL